MNMPDRGEMAQTMYEAYCWDVCSVYPWGELPDYHQRSWMASADAVISLLGGVDKVD